MTSPESLHRPARLSGTVSVAVALLALALLVQTPMVRVAVGVEAAGLVVVAGGTALLRADHRWAGVTACGAGAVLVGAGLVLAAVESPRVSEFLTVAPGLVAVPVVAVGLLRGTGSRLLVKAGAGGLFVAVLVGAVVQEASFDALLASTAAGVVAWDSGEQAINVGEQLGREARTRSVEAVHVLATSVVAGLAVLLLAELRGLGAAELPLVAFVLLLVGGVLLAAALHD